MWRRFLNLLEFIKFSHTVFALPFAFASMLLAAGGLPSLRVLGLILVCMVGARTAAMAFNRYIDWNLDRLNPRTVGRSRLASRSTALMLCAVGVLIFEWGCLWLNPLCLALSPVALILVLGYSITKRFTALSHAFLGLALSVSPVGAWTAVRGQFDSLLPFFLAAAVLCWVFGFDLIYATQDVEFDRGAGLHSWPARYGIESALTLARFLHGISWLILAGFGLLAGMAVPYWISLALIAAALVVEHRLSGTKDLQKLNFAFFQVNALVGFLLLAGVAMSLWIKL